MSDTYCEQDKRVLTVREQARAQGFPDIYEFCSVQERKNQQIKDVRPLLHIGVHCTD